MIDFRLLGFAAALCTASAFGPSLSRRCSCAGDSRLPTRESAAAMAASFDDVFDGRVLSIRLEPDSIHAPSAHLPRVQVVTLAVERRWRGAIPDTVVMRATQDFCVFQFKARERYLVFARNYGGRPYVNSCSPSTIWGEEAARRAALLGPARPGSSR